MLEWKSFEISDREKFNEISKNVDTYSADYCFSALFLWQHKYKNTFAIDNGEIYIKEQNDYVFPIGNLDYKTAINQISKDAKASGNQLKFTALVESDIEKLKSVFGENIDIIEHRDAADYLYTSEKLTNLAGRHLSSKRNHINRFTENGNWEFREVTSASVNEARKFLNDYYDYKNDESLHFEVEAINKMFDNFDELEITAGLLYQNDKPIGFSAGAQINDKVFDVHFEKAIAEIQGAYPMINREFSRLVASKYPKVEYINREEDLGLEGLRRAKLSYKPDILLMKYSAEIK